MLTRAIADTGGGEIDEDEFMKYITANGDIAQKIKSAGRLNVKIEKLFQFLCDLVVDEDEDDKPKDGEPAVEAITKEDWDAINPQHWASFGIKLSKGDLEKARVRAEAEAEQKRYAADAAYQKAERQAKALLYAARKKAEGIRAAKVAEAQGIEAFKQALASQQEGALNLVMMEYARRLKDVQLTGTPVQLQSNLERFQHYQGAAAPGARGGRTGRGR